MKSLIALIIFGICASHAIAVERTVLARVTVYWQSGRSCDRACWNGSRLHAGHCAVDPKRIAYGSTVVFPDRSCVAVDTGPAVVSRTAARHSAKTSAERNAIVVDRFFETKKEALIWARQHPHFMTLRVCDAKSVKRQAKIEQIPPTIALHPIVAQWQKWGCVLLEESFADAL
jgi:3D (Asp-Asp-Asp) domain-containing protein